MFSHAFYNVVHIVGLVLLMAGIGGIATLGATSTRGEARGFRRMLAIAHGLGIFLVLLGGFGMMARLGIVQGSSWPLWVWVKAVIWGTLGVAAFLPLRYPRIAVPLLLLVPVLGGVAAWMAIYKPIW
jgi:hypothetical protein